MMQGISLIRRWGYMTRMEETEVVPVNEPFGATYLFNCKGYSRGPRLAHRGGIYIINLGFACTLLGLLTGLDFTSIVIRSGADTLSYMGR